MSLKATTALLLPLTFLSHVIAHGIVTGAIANGVYYEGYSPNFQYQQSPPAVAGWTAPLTQDHGFVSDYTSPDIICHKSATPGQAYITVSAGSTIELQWTEWPESHHGPVIDYLAPCPNDDCTTVDKTNLQFTKIDAGGLIDGSSPPGHWASDDLIANNNSWGATIPSSIAPGKYVLRHEIIALHSANNQGGAQNYPQCMNLEVTGSGSNGIASGTVGTSLYTATDAGIFVNIYQALTSYVIPGPPVLDGAGSGSGSNSTVKPSGSASASASASTRSSASNLGDVSIIATPSTNIAIPTGIDESASSVPEPTSGSGSGSNPGSGSDDGSNPVPPANTNTPPTQPHPSFTPPPVSFSSTVTGRIGRPTKFVCYLEE
jgi:lytic cellulose monooxygenase (C1-hydroxylating)